MSKVHSPTAPNKEIQSWFGDCNQVWPTIQMVEMAIKEADPRSRSGIKSVRKCQVQNQAQHSHNTARAVSSS